MFPLTALVKALVFATPFVALPTSFMFGIDTTLRTSIAFCIYHFVVALLRVIGKDSWDSFEWLLSIPLLGVILSVFGGAFSFSLLPHLFLYTYKLALDWSGPILIIIEAIQFLRMIIFSGQFVKTQLETSHENIMKIIIIGLSSVAYILCVYLVYDMYINPAMNVPFASFVSSVSTLLVVITLLNVFIENAIISDVAILSLYVLLATRFALFEYSSSTYTTGSWWNFQMFESFFKISASAMSVIALASLPFTFRLTDEFGSDSSDEEV